MKCFVLHANLSKLKIAIAYLRSDLLSLLFSVLIYFSKGKNLKSKQLKSVCHGSPYHKTVLCIWGQSTDRNVQFTARVYNLVIHDDIISVEPAQWDLWGSPGDIQLIATYHIHMGLGRGMSTWKEIN